MKKIIMMMVILILGCKEVSAGLPDETPQIKYEVLRSWIPGRSGIGMDVLISPTSTKNEVLALAKYFVSQHRNAGQIVIFIFDLREAWANRDNDNYSEKKYFQHFLVKIMVPPLDGYDEIKWCKIGKSK